MIVEGVQQEFGAISIDNSTLKGQGYKFSEGLLAQLEQFKDSPARVLQTDIVHNEALKYIAEEITKVRQAIDSAIRSADKQLKIGEESLNAARALLSVEGTEKVIANAKLEEFYESIGALKLNSTDFVELDTLMRMYFDTNAPFEGSKDKKNEFPDAIALLCLEGWAKAHNIKIVAVSEDKGWKSYAEHSSQIVVVKTLAEAMEKFQPHHKVANIIKKIRNDALLEEGSDWSNMIQEAIAGGLHGCDIDINASSYLYYETDDIEVSYSSHELEKDRQGRMKIRMVRSEQEFIVLKVSAIVTAEVAANFSFSIYDSMDKDYVHLGGNTFTTDESYNVDVLLTLEGDFSEDLSDLELVLELTEIEVLGTLDSADFGDVEPDYSNDREDEDF